MASAAAPATIATDPPRTVGELLRRLGGVPADRVRFTPVPGTATEDDLILVNERKEAALCELVEGTLVEKPMGQAEAEIALIIGAALLNFVRPRRLGVVYGADGMLRILPGLVRLPDVSFVSRDRLPGGKRLKEAIAGLAPDLAVEVLSKTNTRAEIARKLREYFEGGTRLVWIVDPKARTVRVHTAPGESTLLGESDALDGGAVLPGFALPVAEVFPGEEV